MGRTLAENWTGRLNPPIEPTWMQMEVLSDRGLLYETVVVVCVSVTEKSLPLADW